MQTLDILRCGAAAATHHGNADVLVFLHLLHKTGGVQTVGTVRVGQARVGLDEHRQAGRHTAAEPFGKGQNLGGAKRTVDAHRIHAKARRCDGVAFHRAAGEGAAPRLKAHGGKHRQSAVFLCGQNGGFQFIQVSHGLQHDKVRPRRRTGPDDLGELGAGIFKGEGPRGSQQFPQRADVQRHQRPRLRGGLPCAVDGGGHHLFQRIAGAGQLFGVGPKGVGIQNLCACAHIIPVDGGERFRHGERRQLRHLAGTQPPFLQLSAHTAIQKNVFFALKNSINPHRSFPSFDRCRSPLTSSGHSPPAPR